MKRTTLFVALASALSISAYAHDQSMKSSQSDQSGQMQQQQSASQSQQSPELVKQAQQKLADAGKDVGTPDGKMGPKTQAALKDFQKEKGLKTSGKLDQETLAALDINQGSSAATGGTSGGSSSSSDQGSSGAGGGPSSSKEESSGSSSDSSSSSPSMSSGSSDKSSSSSGQTSGKY